MPAREIRRKTEKPEVRTEKPAEKAVQKAEKKPSEKPVQKKEIKSSEKPVSKPEKKPSKKEEDDLGLEIFDIDDL